MFPDRYGPKFPINPSIPREIIKDFIEDDPTHKGVQTLIAVQDRFRLYYAARKLVRPHKVGKMIFVDIGTWKGGSAIILHDAFKREGWDFEGHTIDLKPPKGLQPIYDKFLADKVVFYEGTSRFVVESGAIPKDVDLVYADGAHGYHGIKDDITHYHNLVRPGGIMLFHDCAPRQIVDKDKFSKHIQVYISGHLACEELLDKQYRWEQLEIPLLSDKAGKPPGYSHLSEIVTLLMGWRKPI